MILSEEQRLIQETARDFAMREVLPVANELDPVKGDIPMSIRDGLAELGFFGILIPEEYGGLGLGALEYCIVTEELSRAWMSVGSIIRPLIGGQALVGRAEAPVPPGHGPRRKAQRLLHVGARDRLRCRRAELPAPSAMATNG